MLYLHTFVQRVWLYNIRPFGTQTQLKPSLQTSQAHSHSLSESQQTHYQKVPEAQTVSKYDQE